jgi:hypothetical protein
MIMDMDIDEAMREYLLGGLQQAGKLPGLRHFLLDVYELAAKGSPQIKEQKDTLKRYFKDRAQEYPLEIEGGLDVYARIASSIMMCLGVLGGCEKGTAELAEEVEGLRKKDAAFRKDNV